MINPDRLLDKYSLEMVVKNDHNVVLTKDTKYQILASYLSEWYRASSLKNNLIQEVEKVLNGDLPFTDIGADIVGLAYIEPRTTKLFGSEMGYADLELPTKDFIRLILIWLDFIEKS